MHFNQFGLGSFVYLTTKCRYGMRALAAIARAYGRQPVRRKDIRRAEGITEGYLENLLTTLKNNGLLLTVRGAGGGFMLSRPPEEISLLDVYRCLEGSPAPVPCLTTPRYCGKTETCVTRPLWARIHRSIEEILGATTVGDLLSQAETGQKRKRHSRRGDCRRTTQRVEK